MKPAEVAAHGMAVFPIAAPTGIIYVMMAQKAHHALALLRHDLLITINPQLLRTQNTKMHFVISNTLAPFTAPWVINAFAQTENHLMKRFGSALSKLKQKKMQSVISNTQARSTVLQMINVFAQMPNLSTKKHENAQPDFLIFFLSPYEKIYIFPCNYSCSLDRLQR